MIVVTGAAGFIGGNLVKSLNTMGREDIIVVDNLKNGKKFANLLGSVFIDYVDKRDFIQQIRDGKWNGKISAIFHQGACSETTEWDGCYLMENNYEYSKTLAHFCIDHEVPFLYASSAAVYGMNKVCRETPQYESPLNMYGYSKLLFDNYLRKLGPQKSQVVGFRYFNVYGPGEQHKEKMASVAFHLNNQMHDAGVVRLFEGTEGYTDGEQRRDFVYVDDVVNTNLWFWQHSEHSGIYNVGTGRSESFNAVAESVLQWHQRGRLEYIPFPEHLKGCYQSFTQADISALRATGYEAPFRTVPEGVKAYLDKLHALEVAEELSIV